LIPYPITKEFGISYQLLDIYLKNKDIWLTDVGGYGINNWLISEAIVNEARICKVYAGLRKHKPIPGKAAFKLRQVSKTAFEQVLRNIDWWQSRGKVVKELPFSGLGYAAEAEEVRIDWRRMISRFRNGFNRYASLYERLLPMNVYQKLHELALSATALKGDRQAFDFPAWLWAGIVYEFIFAFQFRQEFTHGDLLNALSSFMRAGLPLI
jgi:hypothetical protein